jgi:hypothetical protein
MMNNEQHREDTLYKQWQDGMYVMLDDLADPIDLQGYVLAVVENSLRRSRYFDPERSFFTIQNEDCLAVNLSDAGYWWSDELSVKLTRAQALYIATGDVNI